MHMHIINPLFLENRKSITSYLFIYLFIYLFLKTVTLQILNFNLVS